MGRPKNPTDPLCSVCFTQENVSARGLCNICEEQKSIESYKNTEIINGFLLEKAKEAKNRFKDIKKSPKTQELIRFYEDISSDLALINRKIKELSEKTYPFVKTNSPKGNCKGVSYSRSFYVTIMIFGAKILLTISRDDKEWITLSDQNGRLNLESLNGTYLELSSLLEDAIHHFPKLHS
jgi:hypothetical protein